MTPDPPPPLLTRARATLADWALPLIALGALLVFGPFLGTRSDRIPEGTRLPDAPLVDARTGVKTSLAAVVRQGPTALHVYATWCGVCMREWPDLPSLAAAHAEDVAFVAIALDDPAKVRAHLEAQPVPFPVYLGGEAVARSLRVEVYPSTVFVTPSLHALYDQSGRLASASFQRAAARMAAREEAP